MEETNKIKDFTRILQNLIDSEKHIMDYSLKPLTASGENYGSQIFTININIHNNKSDKQETIKAVVKLYPNNEYIREVFTSHLTFRNELYFYSKILKEFKNLVNTSEINSIHPKFYGGRLSVNLEAEIADEDAVLILEDLEGYRSVNKAVGFDFEAAVLIVKAIAVFNARTVVLREKNPEGFRRIISYVTNIELMFENNEEVYWETWNVVKGALGSEELVEMLKVYMRIGEKNEKKIDVWGDYITLVHNDLWVNNILIKVCNGKTESVKILDMQLITFGSILKDVVFFLLTSVQKEVFKEKILDLIKIFYEEFISTLKKFNCNTEKYGFQKFNEELIKVVRNEMFRVIYEFKFLYLKSETDIHDINPSHMVSMDVSDQFYEKLLLLIKLYKQNNWFQFM